MPTSLEGLRHILVCPACGAEGACVYDERVLRCGPCGARWAVHGRSIQLSHDLSQRSTEWTRKQHEGEARYLDESYNADETIPTLFGGFMAVTLRAADVVLDIGCGIAPTLPVYVRRLPMRSYIGLEPLGESVDREYFCLAGAVAEKIPLRSRSMDAVVFATSLDHVEHLDRCLDEVKRVLNTNGRIYLWVGLYEPEVMAKSMSFHALFLKGSLLRRASKFMLLPLLYARILSSLMVRGYRLRRGIPLDEKHLRYFTRELFRHEMRRNGLRISRELLVPGSNSLFAECVANA